jgi:hypothetical protein
MVSFQVNIPRKGKLVATLLPFHINVFILKQGKIVAAVLPPIRNFQGRQIRLFSQ